MTTVLLVPRVPCDVARAREPLHALDTDRPDTRRRRVRWKCHMPSSAKRRFAWGLTFDMSGGPKGAERPLVRPLDGGVRRQ